MPFDGLVTPSMATDPLLRRRAEAYRRLAPVQRVQSLQEQEESERSRREDAWEEDAGQGAQGRKRRPQGLSERDAERIQAFARLKGAFHIALEEGVPYEFRCSDCGARFDLVNLRTGETVLSLDPGDMEELVRSLERYAGMLADRSG